MSQPEIDRDYCAAVWFWVRLVGVLGGLYLAWVLIEDTAWVRAILLFAADVLSEFKYAIDETGSLLWVLLGLVVAVFVMFYAVIKSNHRR